MPSITRRNLFERALLWEAVDYDNYGQPRIGDPIEIKVRWIKDEEQSEFNNQGEMIAIKATVHVDRVIAIGSKMWLAPDNTYSAESQFYGTGSEGDVTELMNVVGYKELKDEKNRTSLKIVNLMRHMDAMPEHS